MIRLIRSVKARLPEAAAHLAVELTENVKQHHNQLAIEVYIDRFSTGGRSIQWHIDFEDLAHYEKWRARLKKDAKHQDFISKAKEQDLFSEETQTDRVLHVAADALAV